MYLPSLFDEINVFFGYRLEKILWGQNAQFNNTQKARKVGYISGANLMIKRSVIDLIGGFDSDFFMYYEEAELCFRVKKKGLSIYSVPTAQIIHLEGKSFQDKSSRSQYLFPSQVLYYQKTRHAALQLLIVILLKIKCRARIHYFKATRNKGLEADWKKAYSNAFSR